MRENLRTMKQCDPQGKSNIISEELRDMIPLKMIKSSEEIFSKMLGILYIIYGFIKKK